MFRRLTFAVVVVLFAVPSLFAFSRAQDFHPATAEEQAMKTAPLAPGAPAAILSLVRIDNDRDSVSFEYVRIKVFSDEGKKYGDVELPYYPNYPVHGRITEIAARTIRPDGTIAPFSGKVYDKVLYKTGRRSVRAKTFSLADVQPGSILEYRFARRWAQDLLIDTNWSVQRDIPIVHAELHLMPYNTHGQYSTYFTYVGLPNGKKPEPVGPEYQLQLDNMPALPKEAFAPPENQVAARVNFYYTDRTVVADQFWNVEALNWAKKIENFIGRSPGPARTAMAAEFASIESPMERLQKIYTRVQSLRNYSFEEEKTDQEIARNDIHAAKNVEQVLTNKAGYSDEINRAFVALARSAGLDASAARVAPRDENFFSQSIPDATQMSDEIAVVTIGGQPLYFDPGTPYAPFGIVSWEKTNVPAIVVPQAGPPKWRDVPQTPPQSAVVRRNAQLKLDGDALTGTATISFVGEEALVRRVRALTQSEQEQKDSIEKEVKEWLPDGSSVKLTELTGMKSADVPVVATFDLALPAVVSRAGSRALLPPSIFAASQPNPFAPATRVSAIYFEYPRSEEDQVKVVLPAGMRASALPPARLDAGAFSYTNELQQEGSAVTYKRHFATSTLLIEPKYYNAVREFFSAMATADQKQLVLTPEAH
jgi:hypothetical protein